MGYFSRYVVGSKKAAAPHVVKSGAILLSGAYFDACFIFNIANKRVLPTTLHCRSKELILIFPNDDPFLKLTN